MNLSNKIVAIGGSILLGIAVLFMIADNNDTTERTVYECPNGDKGVIFDNGWFLKPTCRTTSYSHVITTELAGEGIKIRYKDGGLGSVDGVVRVTLPDDEVTMLRLHAAVRDDEGLRSKLINPEVKQALNLTAGLMTSEEAYAERRADFANWATEQIEDGIYRTSMNKDTGEVEILLDDAGLPKHNRSPFSEYGINVSGFQVTDWGFEPATEKQINQKREAEMAQITAKENAQRAIQETLMVEEQGKKAVAEEKYRQMQIAQVAITEAEREKEVAVIAAQQIKDVNALALDAAKIDVETAKQQKIAISTRADGEAYAKKAVILADGALTQKLAALVEMNRDNAEAYAKRQVPHTIMNMGSGGKGSDLDNQTAAFMAANLTKSVKSLSVDLGTK
jgi:hypothetical protein